MDIIRLANRDDSSVSVWFKSENGKQSGKLYLRYNHADADYILIFSAEKHFYRLISAYPVFYSRDKARFEKDAEKYCWSYFERK